MDNIVLYTLIALLVVFFFFLFLHNQYYDLANKIAKQIAVPENETVKNETIINTEEEVKRIKEKVEISGETSAAGIGSIANMGMASILNLANVPNLSLVPPSASITPVPTLPASASKVIASAAPATLPTPAPGSAPGSASLPTTQVVRVPGGSLAAFEDYKPANLDLAPKINFTTEPEPPTISGLMNEDLGELRKDLNYFFKTSDVSRQKKRGPPLIKPKPEELPTIKHLYGDGSYDDIDNVHVYKTQ